MLRTDLAELPEISEVEAVRHYTALSRLNYGVDNGLYPLGSCTMKYNPKVNEAVAALPGFSQLHPLQNDSTTQGALQLMFELQQDLAEIAGMDACTLQPAAGSHGELTGIKVIRAFHESRGEHRTKIIVPDSATEPTRLLLRWPDWKQWKLLQSLMAASIWPHSKRQSDRIRLLSC